ncbi:MAG TPA: hypothetical protein PKE29_08420 [Phycisphaerales bacterium]|nr:hypothetical protein [Phycisphaerales bacterium]
MVPWVILLHEASDGTSHYDWLIQSSPVDRQASLISFRVSARPDDPAAVAFEAERMSDHRAAYLSFEGEVRGGRGRVRRVGEGLARIEADNGVFVVTLDSERTWIGERAGFESSLYAFRLQRPVGLGHTG